MTTCRFSYLAIATTAINKDNVAQIETLTGVAKSLGVSPYNSCAVERRFSLVGANPTQLLSLQLVAAKADDGGNDMV